MQAPHASKPSDYRIDITADLNKWRTFVVIAELGSLTRAALYLDTNQSLLSRQLNALERECASRLFTRTGRGVELSEVGHRLFGAVKELLASAEQLESTIRGEAREASGRVTLGILPSIAIALSGRLFSELRERHPAVSIKILEGSSGQVDAWLADAQVDIAVLYRYGASVPEGEQTLAVVDSCLVGPVGDELTRGGEVPFRSLDELPFILPSAPNGVRTALDALGRQEKVTLVPVIEADSLPLQVTLVEREGLYTVLPLHAVWTQVREGKVQAARIVEPPMRRNISMALARSKGPARAVSAVAAHITEIVADMARLGIWHPNPP